MDLDTESASGSKHDNAEEVGDTQGVCGQAEGGGAAHEGREHKTADGRHQEGKVNRRAENTEVRAHENLVDKRKAARKYEGACILLRCELSQQLVQVRGIKFAASSSTGFLSPQNDGGDGE